MIKTICYVVLVVVLVAIVDYEIYTDLKREKARKQFLSQFSDEAEMIAAYFGDLVDNLTKMCDDYDITCTCTMEPKKKDKPEE